MPPTSQVLSQPELNRATLARQGLLGGLEHRSLGALVHRIGSIQAQHPDWPALALHTRRRPDRPPPDLVAARRRRSVVRASLMRMTVHIVAADDLWPMSTLSLPIRQRQWRLLFKEDPQTSRLGRQIDTAHGAVLAAMREQPRGISEIEAILASELNGLRLPNRGLWRHFSGAVQLVHAPIDDERYGRQRYVAAADVLGPPDDDASDWDRAAAHLAEVYLAAFGPASVDDLLAYIGRYGSVSRWRAALQTLGDRLVRFSDEDGRELVDLADAPRPAPDTPVPPRLLARWDSVLLAFGTRHRRRILPPEHQSTVITKNADVLPTFLLDGMVAGTWLPRRRADGSVHAELRPFGRLSSVDRDALEAEAARLLPSLAQGVYAHYPGTD